MIAGWFIHLISALGKVVRSFVSFVMSGLHRRRGVRRDSRTRETILSYRKVYSDPQLGAWAFARLLESGGLFKRIENEEQRAAHNVVVTMLENMGIPQGMNYDELARLVFQLSIPPESIDG